MSLTSQLITETFPDLDKVERLNIEAFPEEERVPLSVYLRYTDNDDAKHQFTHRHIPTVAGVDYLTPFSHRLILQTDCLLRFIPAHAGNT